MRTGVGQGLACHFHSVLCTLHGFNVVCAAGLVLRSCEVVLGHRGCNCFASWEEESLFKFSIRIQLPAGEWHSSSLVSEQVSLKQMALGGFCSSNSQFCPTQVFQSWQSFGPHGAVVLGETQPHSSTVTLKLTAAQCRLSPPPSATHPMHHLSGCLHSQVWLYGDSSLGFAAGCLSGARSES